MTKTREALVDEMIRMYGFEAEETIEFAELAESLPVSDYHDHLLEVLVDCHKHFKRNA